MPTSARASSINDPAAWRGPLRGSVGLGETYVAGLWETDDLVSLIRIAARELRDLDGTARRGDARRGASCTAPARLVPENTRVGARRNISAHYDLGNDLFAAFLDERMMYSCAYFPSEGASLEEAQLAKLERICGQLEARPREPPAGDRQRLGRARGPRRPPPRLPGDDDDDLPRAARAGPPPRRARPASRTG